ncbi:MAG TPA: alpha/beta fold hydrolase [Bradyrhizobium sp.]|jgi:alpha-beta hydrolase superfamily lysophospholipase|nr:alpha/beta fold hydrolase [Bradyrhizobium sp.]
MVTMMISGALKVVLWTLAAVGVATLLLGGLIAWPLRQPPELASISESRKLIDFNTLPVVERFQARDGTELGYRHYSPRGPATDRIAIVVHGSSGSSRSAIHALSIALAARGVESYAVDIRGHGASGTRGDIRYSGQLEDDLADLVGDIRKAHPATPLTLIGHSAGGGFVVRVAGSPIQNLFARTVLLAPYLGYDAPSTRSDSGGWASPDIPRFIALSVLRRLGLRWAESLPTVAFAVPPDSAKVLNASYSYRLMINFAASRDFRQDLATATRPIAIFAGSADELMLPGKYQEAVGNRATIRIIEGINHMGIVGEPAAVSVIADDVATAGLNS